MKSMHELRWVLLKTIKSERLEHLEHFLLVFLDLFHYTVKSELLYFLQLMKIVKFGLQLRVTGGFDFITQLLGEAIL